MQAGNRNTMCTKRRLLSLICFSFWELQQITFAQRIAESKCKEYTDSFSHVAIGGPLLIEPTILEFRTAKCTTSVDLIIGGEEAQVGEFPHQAVLGYVKANTSDQIAFNCGGSLISEWFVLTAAHCGRPKIVRLGEHNLDNDKDGQKDYYVTDFIKHPDYTAKRAYHDIALVQLTRKVKFDDRIRPACLWTSSPFNMTAVVATGFGRSDNYGKIPSTLMKVRLNLIDRKSCVEKLARGRYYHRGLIESQMCVGSEGGGKDTCSGDSGGPIQIATDIHSCAYHIVGVTKGGHSLCGIANSEAIYTQVASYVDWIESVVWE